MTLLVGACTLSHRAAPEEKQPTLPRIVPTEGTQHRQATERCYGNHFTAGCHVAMALVGRPCPVLRCQVDKQRQAGAKYATAAKLVRV